MRFSATTASSAPDAIADALASAINAHDPLRWRALLAPDCRWSDPANYGLTEHLRGFPDLRLTVGDVLVDGERAAFSWTAEGTHRGRWLSIPPTGKRVVVEGTSLLHVRDGRIQAIRWSWDVAGLLRELGLLPALPRPTEQS